MRLPLLTLSAFLTFAAPLHAELLSLSGTKSATWVDPVGGASQDAGTSWLMFGNYNQAGLRWETGANFRTTEQQPFRLGQIFLWNGDPANIPSEVTLRIALDFQQPALGQGLFDFTATLKKDNNGRVSAVFEPGQSASFTTNDGARFRLDLLGLTPDRHWNAAAADAVTSPACAETSGYLWGALKRDDPIVDTFETPEPTTLWILMVGLIALGCHGRRPRNQ